MNLSALLAYNLLEEMPQSERAAVLEKFCPYCYAIVGEDGSDCAADYYYEPVVPQKCKPK